MRWITREHVKIDRIACVWAIRKFIDPQAEFYFVPAAAVLSEAERLGATPFHVAGAALSDHGKARSFAAILEQYGLAGDPALALMSRIVTAADTGSADQAEGPGLAAIINGFGKLGYADDHALVAEAAVVYEALYAYCQGKTTAAAPGQVKQGQAEPR